MRHFNRAILADIAEKGLDPKVAHRVGSDGHLQSKASETPVAVAEEQPSLPAVEEVALEENNAIETSEVIQVEAPKKKSNRFKKKSQPQDS